MRADEAGAADDEDAGVFDRRHGEGYSNGPDGANGAAGEPSPSAADLRSWRAMSRASWHFEDFTEASYRRSCATAAAPLRLRAVRHERRRAPRPVAPRRRLLGASRGGAGAHRGRARRSRDVLPLLHADLYNVLEPAVHARAREIVALGHWLGLHFDAGFYADRLAATLDRRAAWEARVLADVARVPGARGLPAQPVGVGDRRPRRRAARRPAARRRPEPARSLRLRLGLQRLLAPRAAARRCCAPAPTSDCTSSRIPSGGRRSR